MRIVLDLFVVDPQDCRLPVAHGDIGVTQSLRNNVGDHIPNRVAVRLMSQVEFANEQFSTRL